MTFHFIDLFFGLQPLLNPCCDVFILFKLLKQSFYFNLYDITYVTEYNRVTNQ